MRPIDEAATALGQKLCTEIWYGATMPGWDDAIVVYTVADGAVLPDYFRGFRVRQRRSERSVRFDGVARYSAASHDWLDGQILYCHLFPGSPCCKANE